MFGFFGWLRQAVRAAVLGGVQDAVTELATGEQGEVPPVTLRLTLEPLNGHHRVEAGKRLKSK